MHVSSHSFAVMPHTHLATWKRKQIHFSFCSWPVPLWRSGIFLYNHSATFICVLWPSRWLYVAKYDRSKEKSSPEALNQIYMYVNQSRVRNIWSLHEDSESHRVWMCVVVCIAFTIIYIVPIFWWLIDSPEMYVVRSFRAYGRPKRVYSWSECVCI